MAVELYDEHEQGERVRQWIKEYAPAIVMGLVLAFGGIFGFRYWQDQQASQAVLASEYYEVVRQAVEGGNLAAAEEQFDIMRDSIRRNAYVGLAGMHLAAALVADGRLSPAKRIYSDILDDRRMDSLHPVATLRLVRVLEAQGEHDEALALLDRAAPAGFKGAWAEARGDVLFERGRVEEARLAWQEALDNPPSEGANPRLIEMKIDATGPTAEDPS
ncbi:tetratricopeptide repeat protein [Wenzhouxiangella sp. AB-CW3]|uniref:YfgM family protein n=1 Tax=Wenzhouxiangella sp. AB-CW3 TaxID=2771012 RepID=UPI00168AB032|nr:tetratricopeptide repeat protein [Wenzhouxiangella sp. AB-CW3]QOC23985.1 tetratricopeptide repeat protein [Wenzhouxiangella sp. AB-CW3]